MSENTTEVDHYVKRNKKRAVRTNRRSKNKQDSGNDQTSRQLLKQGNYDYTEEDIKKIFGALEKELKNTKNKFLGLEAKEERFTLN